MAKKVISKHIIDSHALLSASGSNRWINCTPSAILERDFVAKNGEHISTASLEGSLAHELAEYALRYSLGQIDKKTLCEKNKKLKQNTLFIDDMLLCAQQYADYVTERYTLMLSTCSETEVLIETRIDYGHVVENGFGRLDAGVVSEDVLEVIDYKFGKGYVVTPIDNTQLKIYALGILRKYDLVFDIQKIRLTIIQPRIDKEPKYWELSKTQLLDWADKILKNAAYLAYRGLGYCVAGDWCKFCKVKNTCQALASKYISLEGRFGYAPPNALSKEKIAEILHALPGLLSWAESIKNFAEKEALNGSIFPGFKLSNNMYSRTWKDENNVIKALIKAGIPKKDLINKKVKGILEIEKLLGAKRFTKLLGKYVEKKQMRAKLKYVGTQESKYTSPEDDFKN